MNKLIIQNNASDGTLTFSLNWDGHIYHFTSEEYFDEFLSKYESQILEEVVEEERPDWEFYWERPSQ
jgi:YHS domain-containing protein